MNEAIIQALALKAEGLRVQASDLLIQTLHEALCAGEFELVNEIIYDTESKVDTWWISIMCAMLLVSKPWRHDVDPAWMKLHESLMKRVEVEGGPADIKQMLSNMLSQ